MTSCNCMHHLLLSTWVTLISSVLQLGIHFKCSSAQFRHTDFLQFCTTIIICHPHGYALLFLLDVWFLFCLECFMLGCEFPWRVTSLRHQRLFHPSINQDSSAADATISVIFSSVSSLKGKKSLSQTEWAIKCFCCCCFGCCGVVPAFRSCTLKTSDLANLHHTQMAQRQDSTWTGKQDKTPLLREAEMMAVHCTRPRERESAVKAPQITITLTKHSVRSESEKYERHPADWKWMKERGELMDARDSYWFALKNQTFSGRNGKFFALVHIWLEFLVQNKVKRYFMKKYRTENWRGAFYMQPLCVCVCGG